MGRDARACLPKAGFGPAEAKQGRYEGGGDGMETDVVLVATADETSGRAREKVNLIYLIYVYTNNICNLRARDLGPGAKAGVTTQ